MLDVDAKRRITASELVRDPYIMCSDLRLTAFETAGSTFRSISHEHYKKYGRVGVPFIADNFKRESIKDAHITTIEHLVSSS